MKLHDPLRSGFHRCDASAVHSQAPRRPEERAILRGIAWKSGTASFDGLRRFDESAGEQTDPRHTYHRGRRTKIYEPIIACNSPMAANSNGLNGRGFEISRHVDCRHRMRTMVRGVGGAASIAQALFDVIAQIELSPSHATAGGSHVGRHHACIAMTYRDRGSVVVGVFRTTHASQNSFDVIARMPAFATPSVDCRLLFGSMPAGIVCAAEQANKNPFSSQMLRCARCSTHPAAARHHRPPDRRQAL